MANELKFCADCKHRKREDFSESHQTTGGISGSFGREDRCYSPYAKEEPSQNLVTGKELKDSGRRFLRCSDARYSDLVAELCGRSAKWFEPKEEGKP